jgi:ABC-type antimicrobial peptide transport system permease subunit
VQFNASAVGAMAYDPWLQDFQVVWDSAFLQQELGGQLYNQTFGGGGANFFVVKASDLAQVEPVATKLSSIFSDYPGFSVTYDQAALDAQRSFESQSGFLYGLIGAASLLSVVSIVFLFTYVFSNRRRWETGLLITQGWSWRRVVKLFFYYYLILGIAAVAISAPLSLLIGSQVGFSFQVYANTLVIPILISPYLLVSSVVISLLVSTVAAYFAVWRMKKMGLDNLLREY